MAVETFLGFSVDETLWRAGVAGATVLASIVLSDLLLFALDRVIKPLLAKTKTDLDDLLFAAIRGPAKLFIVMLGAYYALVSNFPSLHLFGSSLEGILAILLIAGVGHTFANAAGVFLKWYDSRLAEKQAARKDVFPFARKIVIALIYLATLLVILPRMGVEITPLLASLGIAGLAVALALQDSLKNFFAGIYLLADRPIRSGEYIALDSDQSRIIGFVEEIGWRSTRIRTRSNYSYIIPNERLASSIIANFSRGEGKWVTATVEVSVAYESDLAKVKKTLVDAVKAVAKANKSISLREEPVARIDAFGDSAINMKLFFQVHEYTDQLQVADEVRGEILSAFEKSGIEIPYPQRVMRPHPPSKGKK